MLFLIHRRELTDHIDRIATRHIKLKFNCILSGQRLDNNSKKVTTPTLLLIPMTDINSSKLCDVFVF